MRYGKLVALCAGCFCVLSGCPRSSDQSTTDGSATVADTGVAAATTPEMAPQEPIGTADALPGEPPEGPEPERSSYPVYVAESDLEVLGVRLYCDFETISARYPEDGALETMGMWEVEGELGLLDIHPRDGSMWPVETAAFMDGKLVGFTHLNEEEPGKYERLIKKLERSLGEGTREPPEWTRRTDMFREGYQGPPEEWESSVWHDEAARAVLVAAYDPGEGVTLVKLLNVDRYPDAVDAATKAFERQVLQPEIPGGLGPMPEGPIEPGEGEVGEIETP